LGSVDDLRDRRLCFGRPQGTYCSTVTGACDGRSGSNGASRNNGWYAGGGFDYMVHKGPLVDVLLGLEYQHFDVGRKTAFCCNLVCSPLTIADYDLDAKATSFALA
jgi:hypothetical protein